MRLILGLMLLISSLFAVSQTQAEVVAVNKDRVTLNKNIIKGVSGIIVHHYNDKHSAIVATVVSLGAKEARIVNAKYVQNTRLPDIATPVSVGDKAVMGYLYNRSLLIAPNQATYDDVTGIYPSMDFVHPDLLAFSMMREGIDMPTKESIQEYCNQNAIGLVYLVAADMGYFIDVNSFQILSVEPVDSSGDRMLPFFMRLERLDGGVVGLFESLYEKVKDDILGTDKTLQGNYDMYYLNLMGSNDGR